MGILAKSIGRILEFTSCATLVILVHHKLWLSNWQGLSQELWAGDSTGPRSVALCTLRLQLRKKKSERFTWQCVYSSYLFSNGFLGT